MRKEHNRDILRELWDGAEPVEWDLPAPASVIADAERTVSWRRRIRLAWTVAAAAVVAALLTVGLVGTGRNPLPETILASSADGKGSFQLPDGSTVWLNRGSSLTYAGRLEGKTRTVTLSGEAYFDVAKDPDHPFIVKARDLDIQVLGTKFVVTSYADGPVSTCLAEGCISATSAHDSTPVILRPGQMLILSEAGRPGRVEEVDVADYFSWLHEEAEEPAVEAPSFVPSSAAVPAASVRREVTLRGTVRDTDRKPMPGVSVQVVSRGTSYGAVTGVDGTFELTLPTAPRPDERISFRFPGCAEEICKVGTASVFDIVLTH